MALINCSECGAQISSTAKQCPKCGAPNTIEPEKTETTETGKAEEIVLQNPPIPQKKKSEYKRVLIIVSGALVLLAGAIIFFIKNQGPSAEEIRAMEKVREDSIARADSIWAFEAEAKEKARQDSIEAIDKFFSETETQKKSIPVGDDLIFLTEYAGKYPKEVGLLENEQIKRRLVKMIGSDKYNFIRKIWEMQDKIEIEGEYLYHFGFAQHSGGDPGAVLMINIPRNVIYVGIRNNGIVTFFSEKGKPIPQRLINWGADPKTFLQQKSTWRKNFFGNIVVEGYVSNTHQTTGYGDIDMKVTYIKTNGQDAETKWFKLGYIKPGSSLSFKREFGKSAYTVSSVKCEVSGAKSY